jgi:hypothetical protein
MQHVLVFLEKLFSPLLSVTGASNLLYVCLAFEERRNGEFISQ